MNGSMVCLCTWQVRSIVSHIHVHNMFVNVFWVRMLVSVCLWSNISVCMVSVLQTVSVCVCMPQVYLGYVEHWHVYFSDYRLRRNTWHQICRHPSAISSATIQKMSRNGFSRLGNKVYHDSITDKSSLISCFLPQNSQNLGFVARRTTKKMQ